MRIIAIILLVAISIALDGYSDESLGMFYNSDELPEEFNVYWSVLVEYGLHGISSQQHCYMGRIPTTRWHMKAVFSFPLPHALFVTVESTRDVDEFARAVIYMYETGSGVYDGSEPLSVDVHWELPEEESMQHQEFGEC